jgi:hypothetical protein
VNEIPIIHYFYTNIYVLLDTINPVTNPNKTVYNQKDIFAIAKIIFSLNPVKDIEFYRQTFITTKDMYKIMRRLMPNLEESFNERSFAINLSSRYLSFGITYTTKGRRGRYLYVLKDECIDLFISKDKREQE